MKHFRGGCATGATARAASAWRLGAIAAITWLIAPAASAAEAPCKLRTVEMPVSVVNSRAIATVKINGTPVPLTVDSGAFYSFLTDAAAAQLGLRTNRFNGVRVEGINGEVETRVTEVQRLELLGGSLPRVEFLVGGTEPGAGTLGLLGRNLLTFADTEFDLAHGMIRFHFPSDGCENTQMAYWAGETPVNEVDLLPDPRMKLPALRADIRLNGHDVVAVFDSGAVNTMATRRAADRAGLSEADLEPMSAVYGSGRRQIKAWSAPFARIEIGEETISNSRWQVADFRLADADVLLGIDYFLAHRIYVSKQQSKMYLTYNGGRVFALNAPQAPAAAASEPDGAASAPAIAATADQLARRGMASAARGDLVASIADLDQAIELDPGHADWFARRAAAQQGLKHPLDALQDLDRALTLDPSHAEARLRRALLRVEAHDDVHAAEDVDRLDGELPVQSALRIEMATLYLRLEKPAQAVAQIDEWLDAHRRDAGRTQALSTRCWARMEVGTDLERALDDCDAAVDADPKNTVYAAERGWVLLRLGRSDTALIDFNRALAVRPDDAWAHYGRALVLSRRGQAATAEPDFAAARKAFPAIDRWAGEIGIAEQATKSP